MSGKHFTLAHVLDVQGRSAQTEAGAEAAQDIAVAMMRCGPDTRTP
jgi:hypothetical protein